MKIRLEKPALNNFKAYEWQKWKTWRGALKWKTISINGFPIPILQPKSKEERTEVISRLLSTFVTHKLQEHLNFSLHFLNFSELFQYIFILVSQLWCHEFRKHSFNHILKVCKGLLKNQHVVLKACKHVTFL